MISRRSLIAAVTGGVSIPVWTAKAAPVASPDTLEGFGAVGDGRSDDTAAINRACRASAVSGRLVLGRPGAIYKVSASGRKAFLSPGGNTYQAAFAVEVPNGAAIDFRGATIAPTGQTIAICNGTSDGSGSDKISIAGLVIDAGAAQGMTAIFVSCAGASFADIKIVRSSENAICFAALKECSIDRISVDSAVGNGITLGGNVAWQLSDCRIGILAGTNIRSLGTVHQPGNPFLIGARNSTIKSLSATNCGGGIKFAPNCHSLQCGSVLFDGIGGIRGRFGTQNSGLKIQGDDAGSVASDIAFETVTVQNATGAGIFLKYAENISIGTYIGRNNGLIPNDADVACEAGASIHIQRALIDAPLQRALFLNRNAGRVVIDTFRVNPVSNAGLHMAATFSRGPNGGPPGQGLDTIVAQGGMLDIGEANIGTAPRASLRMVNGADRGTHINIRRLLSDSSSTPQKFQANADN